MSKLKKIQSYGVQKFRGTYTQREEQLLQLCTQYNSFREIAELKTINSIITGKPVGAAALMHIAKRIIKKSINRAAE